MYWWPFDGNAEILEIIREKAGGEAFLESFGFLLDYPIKFYFHDLEKVLLALERLPRKYNKEVMKIFQKIISIEPKYFDRYEIWIIKKNVEV
jgi:hypothetical protein